MIEQKDCYNEKAYFYLNDKNNLIIDFKIKTYKIMDNGWKTRNIPSDYKVTDKLELNFKNIVDIYNNFSQIIKKNELLTKNVTSRGFPYLELKDVNNEEISLQMSSVWGMKNYWFGINSNIKDNNGNLINSKNILVIDRLHLSTKEIKEVHQLLEKYIIELVQRFNLKDFLEKKDIFIKNFEIFNLVFENIDSEKQYNLIKTTFENLSSNKIKKVLEKNLDSLRLYIEEKGKYDKLENFLLCNIVRNKHKNDISEIIDNKFRLNGKVNIEMEKWMNDNKIKMRAFK